METKALTSATLVALAAITLTACGGGGSSTSPSTPTKTCANGGTDYPTCTAPVTPASLQQALPATYATGSAQAETFAALNEFRTSMGLGPVNQNKLIDAAALNHHNYAISSWVPGDDPHGEIAGRTNFTGADVFARFKFVGVTNFVSGGEVMDAENGKLAVQGLADTVLHRQAMMLESTTDVGIFSEPEKGTIIDFGYSKGQSNASDYIGIYPIDKQTGIFLTHALESPNPFTDLEMTKDNMCKQTSYPISIQSQATTTLSVDSFTVREFGTTTDLPVRLFQPGTNRIGPNTAFIVGKAPFKPFTTYTVQFSGKVSGGITAAPFNVNKSWSFTTGQNYLTCTN